MPFTWQDAPSESLAIVDFSAKAAYQSASVAEPALEAPVRAAGPAPMERLEQMVSREVLSIRQSGASTLGVALKLDANTQLFLQLTTTNGLTQASVRLDRGQFAPEDSQWAQLQQSLARQNVELLPMVGGSNLNFQEPSEEQSAPACRARRLARVHPCRPTTAIAPTKQRAKPPAQKLGIMGLT